MRVVSTEALELEDGTLRVITILAKEPSPATTAVASSEPLGEGPTRDAVPDRIVRFLLTCGERGAQLSQIQRAIGGKAATANRQIWTVGTGQSDTPARLRGWVEPKGDGRYALTAAAWEQLKSPQWAPFVEDEIRRALAAVERGVQIATDATGRWREGIERGETDAAARAESDRCVYALVDDARQANLVFGQIRGWDGDGTNDLIMSLQALSRAYQRAIYATKPEERTRALNEVAGCASEATRYIKRAFSRGSGGGAV